MEKPWDGQPVNIIALHADGDECFLLTPEPIKQDPPAQLNHQNS